MNSKWLLSLYPEIWRKQYEDEFSVVLEQCPASPRMIMDIVWGAIDIQLHLEQVLGQQLSATYRLRRRVLIVLSACLLFLLGGWIFYSTVDDSVFATALHSNQLLGGLWLVMEIGNGLTVLGLTISNLPMAFIVLRELLINQRRQLWRVIIPTFSLCTLGLYLLLIRQFIDPIIIPALNAVVGYGFWILFWAAIIIFFVSICKAITYTYIPESTFRVSLSSGIVTLIAMGLIIVAALAWLTIARVVLAEAFNQQGFLNISPMVSFVMGLLCMVVGLGITGQIIIRNFPFGRDISRLPR